MSISRRHFIAGAGAATVGLIVPSFAARVLAHVATFGKPLLEFSRETDCLWYALPVDLEDSRGYLLIDTSIPLTRNVPDMTWRQFLEIRGDPVETWFEEWNLKPDQLDDPANCTYTQIWWNSTACPSARVFNRLGDLEPQLGRQLTTRGPRGLAGGRGRGGRATRARHPGRGRARSHHPLRRVGAAVQAILDQSAKQETEERRDDRREDRRDGERVIGDRVKDPRPIAQRLRAQPRPPSAKRLGRNNEHVQHDGVLFLSPTRETS